MPTTTYHRKDGQVVPSVTAITNTLDKGRSLLHWAYSLGRSGQPLTQTEQFVQDAGTSLHAAIVDYLFGNLSPESMAAMMGLSSWEHFLSFQSQHELTPIWAEEHLVSERYHFGGTPDLLAVVDGKWTIVDFKSSKTVYTHHRIQVSAYKLLAEEAQWTVEQVAVLALGGARDYDYQVVQNPDTYAEVFLSLLRAHNLLEDLGDRIQ